VFHSKRPREPRELRPASGERAFRRFVLTAPKRSSAVNANPTRADGVVMVVCLDVDSFHWWQPPNCSFPFTAADTLLLRPPFCPFSIRELSSQIDAFVLNGYSSRYRPLAFCLAYCFKLLACCSQPKPSFLSSALIVLDEKRTHTKHRVCARKGIDQCWDHLLLPLLYNRRVNTRTPLFFLSFLKTLCVSVQSLIT